MITEYPHWASKFETRLHLVLDGSAMAICSFLESRLGGVCFPTQQAPYNLDRDVRREDDWLEYCSWRDARALPSKILGIDNLESWMGTVGLGVPAFLTYSEFETLKPMLGEWVARGLNGKSNSADAMWEQITQISDCCGWCLFGLHELSGVRVLILGDDFDKLLRAKGHNLEIPMGRHLYLD